MLGLSQPPRSVSLFIEKTKLCKNSINILFEHLAEAPCLKVLCLSDVGLQLDYDEQQQVDPSQIKYECKISHLISSKHCRIAHLSLTGNELGINACLNLCEGLILNQCNQYPLRRLELSKNQIGYKGTQLLCESLKDNPFV